MTKDCTLYYDPIRADGDEEDIQKYEVNTLAQMIKKWDDQIALHRRVCDDPLMYTKEERLKNSHYAQAICAIVADLKKIT